MNGDAGVTKGLRLPPLARAYVTIAAFTALVTTFNIFTALHDAAEHSHSLAVWEPTTWEYTSGIATLLSCGIIYWAIRIAPPAREAWPKFLAVHAVSSLAFSAVHILLMNVMRVAIYGMLRRHYEFGEAGFWYEYRKDLIAYVIWAAIFWFFIRERAAAPSSADGRMFHIQDGKRLVRVAVEEIAAIHAAGNYVEFVLVDNRRPLMRQSLSIAQRELGDNFIRTHRSWAINAVHVRELRSTGAGDYEIELRGGIKVPLSRRFPDALARLRSRPQLPVDQHKCT